MTYGIDESDAQAHNHPRHQGHGCTDTRRLDASTDESQYTPNDDCLLSSILVTETSTDETSKHGTKVVYSDDTTLFGGVCNDTISTDTDRVDIVWDAIDRSHDPLVVA